MKKNLLMGLAIFLPIALTIDVIVFLVNLFTNPFMGVVSEIIEHTGITNVGIYILSPEQVITYTSQILILLFIFLFSWSLGRWFFLHYFVQIGEKIVQKIPYLRNIHKTTKDILKSLFLSKKDSFKKVVLIPYPNKETYALGFLTNDNSPFVSGNLASVLIPFAPTPTSGFLVLIPKEDILETTLTPKEAIKYIVSCGVIMNGNKK